MDKKIPILWASILRLTACMFIFIYHFLVLHTRPSYGLGSYGLYIFFFLAGWFAVNARKKPADWLKGRLRRIMIPYWPVIFAVLIANRIAGYKETTLLKDIMTFAGLSLFVENPVYVISWFITMIVMLDMSFFVFRIIKHTFWKIVSLMIFSIFFYTVTPGLIRSVFLFYLGAGMGYVLRDWPGVSADLSQRFTWYRILNESLFTVQNYTYSFFLIHGAVLIFVIRTLKAQGMPAFVFALGLSVFSAYAHNRLFRKFS